MKYLYLDKIIIYFFIGLIRRCRGVRVRINVSGMIFEIFEFIFLCFLDFLLGFFKKCEKYYDLKNREFFFDRNCVVFDFIFYFY